MAKLLIQPSEHMRLYLGEQWKQLNFSILLHLRKLLKTVKSSFLVLNMIFYQILYTKLPIYGKKRFLKKSPYLHKTSDISVQAKVFSVWLLKDVTQYYYYRVKCCFEIKYVNRNGSEAKTKIQEKNHWQSPVVSVPKPGIEPGTFRSSV